MDLTDKIQMRKGKQVLVQMIPVIVVIAATVLVSVFGYHTIVKTEEEQSWSTLGNAADTLSNEIRIRMTDNGNFLKMIANSMMEMQSWSDDEKIALNLRNVQETTIFNRIDVFFPDNTILNSDGIRTESKLPLTFEEMAAKGIHMSRRNTDPVTGDYSVGYAVPVTDGTQVYAVLIGILDCDQLKTLFQAKVYDENTMVCVIDSADGNFIIDNWHDELGNLNEVERKMTDGYDETEVKNAMLGQQSGKVTFQSGETGENAHMYYEPVGMFGWEILVAQHEGVVFASVELMKEILLGIGAVGLLLLCGYLAISIRRTNQLMKSMQTTEEQLQISNTINECVRALTDSEDMDFAINELMKIINHYFDGDRTYLFENDYEKMVTNNIYEYAIDGVTKEIDNLQNVPLEYVSFWMKKFREQGTFYISDRDEEIAEGSGTYELLEAQNIHSLIAVPLLENGQITGFLGVDNPKQNYEKLAVLKTIEFYISDSMYRRNEEEKLKRMSYIDEPTGIYNRNKFESVLEECRESVHAKIGIAYFDLNGLKATNDNYGHKAGDRLIWNAADSIRQTFASQVFRIGGDEFLVLATDCDKEEFYRKIEEVKEELERRNVSAADGALWEPDSSGIDEQIRQAEAVMYEDKRKYHERKKDRK